MGAGCKKSNGAARWGLPPALRLVVEAKPEILAHNVDTVERLVRSVRPGARYWRSVSLLGAVKRIDPSMLTKSAIILGMGETEEEIEGLDLSQHSETGYTFADRGGSLSSLHGAADRSEEPTGRTPAEHTAPATEIGCW